MYSPSIGRFLQTDPVGYITGINLYTYCDNNPINWIDPFGHDKKKTSLWDEFWLSLYYDITGQDPTFVTYGLMESHKWIQKERMESTIWWLTEAPKGTRTAGAAFASLFTEETYFTLLGAASLASSASKTGAKYTVDAVRYQRAGGGGVRLLRNGKRVMSADWHQWGQTAKNAITKFHIDIKGVVKHFPWKSLGIK